MENSVVVKHDNLDLIRALLIKDNYLSCKNGIKYDIVYNASFKEENLNEEKIKMVYEKYPILNVLDEKYLKNGNYTIGFVVISKHRLLKNLSNYKGKGNALEESLKYKANIELEKVEEVVRTLSAIEMGDESVNVSKGIQHY